jgi:DNA-binding NarL/FixJ family response regulator
MLRIILVGRAADRARVRREVSASSIEIVAEFENLADARASNVSVDAVMLAEDALPAVEADEPLIEPLTPRESDVLELLTEGLSNKAIAARLGISDQTVKFHIAAILAKLGAANRTDAVRLALRRGLVHF